MSAAQLQFWEREELNKDKIQEATTEYVDKRI